MADKNRTFAAPKNSKFKRPATMSARKLPSLNTVKSKGSPNATIINENDMTMRQDIALPDFDPINREIAYGNYVRAMLGDCLVDETIKREETELDIQMAQLSDRFIKTINQLDHTNRRIKDISFVEEQKRLLDLKSDDFYKFCNMTDNSNIQEISDNLTGAEKSCLDKLETKNVDFGYNKESGHKQLLEAVNEAIDGLEEIKRHSNLDLEKFKEYSKSKTQVKDLEKDRFDLESLKTEFDIKFPKFSEKLLKEASEKIAQMMKCDEEAADEASDDDDDD